MAQFIGHDEVLDLVDRDAQLIDVLPAKEYERIHLPRAINLPLTTLTPESATRVARDRPVVVYCYDYQ